MLTSCTQPRKLNEVSRIEEKFVHLAQLIDSETLLDENVEILKRVLRSIPDVMRAENASRLAIND